MATVSSRRMPSAGSPAARVAGAVRSLSRTTPGQLALLGAGLVALSLLVGVLAAAAVASRLSAGRDLVTGSEPLSVAGQEIYRALSDADATAASAFLSGGLEPADVRARYQADLAAADAALATAAVGGAPEIRPLATQLPVYTGLVETARADNRLGFPVGAAYLAEASGLMRSALLPAAERLYQSGTAAVTADSAAAATFPVSSLVLGVALLAGLVLAQRWLTRRTHRVLNVGLLVATVAALLGLLWQAVALGASTADAKASRSDGSVPLELLSRARIAALQGRADETLALVARGNGGRYEADFGQRARDGGDLLGGAKASTADPATLAGIEAAAKAGGQWRDAHQQLRTLDDTGSYPAAVTLAIGTAAEGAGGSFGRLDAALGAAIEAARSRFVDEAGAAQGAQTALAPGLVVLALVAAGGCAAGIGARLREYR